MENRYFSRDDLRCSACRATPAAPQQFHSDWFLREAHAPGYYNSASPPSEDCLYLNIAAPAKSANDKLTVYVSFHAGRLTNGFAVDAPTAHCCRNRRQDVMPLPRLWSGHAFDPGIAGSVQAVHE
ncbi:carboxylesterase family protein [Poseidonocella sp. HB161398]|uniref:carboxylesterase family protein n=1 Tax=Poseidonocella sp. HB161398 TaxID=2320855 RepID=UPI003517A78D